MLDEECLNGGEKTARTALFLKDSINYILIEEKSLDPRIVEMAPHISKQLLFEAVVVNN